jgi:hypothetical protein
MGSSKRMNHERIDESHDWRCDEKSRQMELESCR